MLCVAICVTRAIYKHTDFHILTSPWRSLGQAKYTRKERHSLELNGRSLPAAVQYKGQPSGHRQEKRAEEMSIVLCHNLSFNSSIFRPSHFTI